MPPRVESMLMYGLTRLVLAGTVSSPGGDGGESVVEFSLPLGYRLGMLEASDLHRVTQLLLCCFPVPLPDVPLITHYSPGTHTRRTHLFHHKTLIR